jgi:thiol:disulfide interchange protein DsbD
MKNMKRPNIGLHLSKCLLLLLATASIHPYTSAQQSTAPGIQKRLSDLFSSPKEEELLEPDLAFKMKVAASGPTTLVVDLIPANGYYLYRDRIRFALKNTRGVAIKSVKLPAGKVKNDPTFGRMETYEKPIQAEIALERAPNAKTLTLAASYQGCNEKTGVCYPPQDKEVNLSLP